MDSAAAALLGMGLAAAGFAGAGIGIGYIFGKMIEAVARQPEAEAGRQILRIGQLIRDSLQGRHPARHEMAILQEDPMTVPRRVLHQAIRTRPLALAERHAPELGVEPLVRGKLPEVARRVSATREHKEEGRRGRRLVIRGMQV